MVAEADLPEDTGYGFFSGRGSKQCTQCSLVQLLGMRGSAGSSEPLGKYGRKLGDAMTSSLVPQNPRLCPGGGGPGSVYREKSQGHIPGSATSF